MPMIIKFLTKSNGEKIVKIGQYLAKIWTKYDSIVFGPPCTTETFIMNACTVGHKIR